MGRPGPHEPDAVRDGGAWRRIDVVPAAGLLRVARASSCKRQNPDRAGALLRCVVPGFRRVAGLEIISALTPVTLLRKFSQQLRQFSQRDDLALGLHDWLRRR